MNKPLKYLGYTIVFQEVPDEVTLAINISGCPHHCDKCHSQYLWEYEGRYIRDDLRDLIEKYRDYVTCVCFMGGDQSEELLDLISVVKSYNLKAALYSGYSSNFKSHFAPYFESLDYLKIGPYIDALGGLDKDITNQRMYAHSNNEWKDITYKFKKKGLNEL